MVFQVESNFSTIDGLRAYVATPKRPRSATLLLPMITGIGARVREFADQVAAHTGALALVWDPWHGKSLDDTPFAELQELHAKLEDEAALAEQRRLLNHLESRHGFAGAGVVGWCLGGRFAVLLGARDSRVSGVVAYHPTLPAEPPPTHTVDAIEAAATVPAPVMVHYPGKDSLVPYENFAALQAALQGRDTGSATIVHLYPQAKHGFSDSARHNEQVNADAWGLSWPQTLEFLKATTNGSE